MNKFLRNYELSIQYSVGSNPLIIKPPFTIEFDISRHGILAINHAQIKIFNLNEDTRAKIYYDRYTDQAVFNDGSVLYKQIILKAGYGDSKDLPVLFKGNITQGSSLRQGDDFITTIECLDGGSAYAGAIVNMEFPAGTEQRNILTSIAASLAVNGVTLGAIGNYPGILSRGNAYSGSTMDILDQISCGGTFIDNEQVNCLGLNEVIRLNSPLVINSQSGLLGTPMKEQSYLSFTILFEPKIQVGTEVILESVTEKRFSGFFKITSIHHRGMISSSVCGDAITEMGVLYGTQSLIPVQVGP